jgi:hypothetical protein
VDKWPKQCMHMWINEQKKIKINKKIKIKKRHSPCENILVQLPFTNTVFQSLAILQKNYKKQQQTPLWPSISSISASHIIISTELALFSFYVPLYCICHWWCQENEKCAAYKMKYWVYFRYHILQNTKP